MKKSSLALNTPVVAPVYDILNCGPRKRFLANGKLVSNSGANNINAQNFSRGGTIRKCIQAPPNHLLIVSDLSQIEVRVLAWLAGEEKLLDLFRQGGDIYCQVGSLMFGQPINKTDHAELRRQAKSAVLGCGFGMGSNKFQLYNKILSNELSEERSYELVNLYRTTFPRIPLYWNLIKNRLPYFSSALPIDVGRGCTVSDNRITLPSGRRLHYEGLHYDHDEQTWKLKNNKRIYQNLIVENITQALARDIFVHKMLRIPNVVMHSHDEVVVVAPEAIASETAEIVQWTMTQPIDWVPDLPINAETTIAKIYGDAK